MTWLTDIIRGLRELGGTVSLSRLYRWIELNRAAELPANYKSLIRASLQKYCPTSAQYDPTNPPLFQNPERGVWSLRRISDIGSVKINQMDLYALAIDTLSEEELKSLRSEGDVLTALAAKGRELLFAYNSSEK